MTKQSKRERGFWATFLEGIGMGALEGNDDDQDEGYDPFRYAPGPPFRRRKHPGHMGSVMRWFGRRRHR